MGIEFDLRYQPRDRAAWDGFVGRLGNLVSDGWPAFTVERSALGEYFCHHGRSEVAAVADAD